MKSSSLLTKILAISGTILVGLPVFAPIVFSLIRLIQSGHLMFDYLMPAELGFLVLVGAVFLIWAAIRAHTRVRLILWTSVAAVVTVVGGQALAVVTGLADGSISQTSPWMVVVISLLAAFDLLVLLLLIGGCLLCRDIFTKPEGSITNQ